MAGQKGVLQGDFHEERQKKLTMRYSLYRRTKAVSEVIRKQEGISTILDIGTADGIMLDRVARDSGIAMPVGMDFSAELLKSNDSRLLNMIRGDAQYLPVRGETFDAVIVTAVIEHVPRPELLVAECRRVLKPGGLCIITTPDPFFERVATRIGYLKEENHNRTFDLPSLEQLLIAHGFQVCLADKFMLSPIGMPLEDLIEKLVKSLGLKALLMNQIVVVKKV